MDLRLQVFLLVCCLGLVALCIQLLRHGIMEYKVALLWMAGGFLMLLVSIFPKPLFLLAQWVGIVEPVNMVFLMAFFLTLLLLLVLSVVVSKLSTRIRILTQAIALLEKRVMDKHENVHADTSSGPAIASQCDAPEGTCDALEGICDAPVTEHGEGHP